MSILLDDRFCDALFLTTFKYEFYAFKCEFYSMNN